ncbi:hypothetical protein CIPAW_06G100200 [Carya illinoinensis]|uniref:Transmembrane protein n=1 Tax=Carya illinoinensis TaxID=32201 RepID=A0A8T1QA97_CARIL|nr:hypothetical protein CIPAW_06G100200 [Carya illinoinensis]
MNAEEENEEMLRPRGILWLVCTVIVRVELSCFFFFRGRSVKFNAVKGLEKGRIGRLEENRKPDESVMVYKWSMANGNANYGERERERERDRSKHETLRIDVGLFFLFVFG